MKHLTDRARNPFGVRAPCEDADGPVVYGYGDPNADFHLIGNHPGAHGGRETGVPFTGSTAGERLQPVLHELGFLAEPYSDEPALDDLFASYRHMCPTPDDGPPGTAAYDRLERYFDAELRAINAHVLLPVGERATRAIVDGYTTLGHKLDVEMASLHATELRGRGFMVLPIRDPRYWTGDDRNRLVEKLTAVLESDYRQTKGVATLVG